VERLKAYRKKHPQDHLIFPNANGRPEQHFLRRLKILALKARLNCGHCVNKKGLRCDEHAVCENWELHKFRKSALVAVDCGIGSRQDDGCTVYEGSSGRRRQSVANGGRLAGSR
jgi:hypothetical protein